MQMQKKIMKLSVAAIATKGTTARTSNRIARSLTKVSADSFFFFFLLYGFDHIGAYN